MRKRELQLGMNKAKTALRKWLLVVKKVGRELTKTKLYIWLDPRNYTGTRRVLQQALLLAMTGLLLFSAISPLIDLYVTHRYYSLNSSTSGLVGDVTDTLAKQITYDSTRAAYVFNASGMTPATQTVGPDKVPLALLQAKVAGNNSKSKSTYSVVMPTDPKAGISYYDSNTGLSFQLVPNFTEMGAQQVDNHIVYPTSGNTQMVYSVKHNGLKEDIVLKQYVSDSLSFSYSLKLPKTLEARLLTDGSGSLGIYSADPSLFNNATTGSDYDPAKIESAQLHAQKDHLVFAIPAPVIKGTGNGERGTKNGGQGTANAYFKLSPDGQTLTVSANNLRGLHYPITVDPTVVITSTSDFSTGNNEDNNISYPANQINRGSLTGGSISGGWTGTTALPSVNYYSTSVTYNGYLYEIGGDTPGLTAAVQYAPINSDGTIGSWTATTSLPLATDSATSVAYNGYIYEIGGCNPTCASTTVDYAHINANGSIGAWTATTALPAGNRFSTSVAYNGYLYEIGGYISGASAIVDYAPINADGTIGAWTATTSLPAATYGASSAVYNGYVYILGGYTAGPLTTVVYAPINSNGTIGAWTATTALPVATDNATSVVYNGYLYEIGGWDASSVYFNTVRYAPINANGSIGAWTATATLSATTDHATSAVYNGYIYEIGGFNGTTSVATVSYAKIDPAGMTTAYSTTTALPAATSYSTSVAYNGYLYEIGGYLTANVYYAPINANGTIGAWTATTALPTATYDASSVTYNGYLYLIGGYNTSSATVVVDYALINANGTIGAWTATTSLPASTTSYNASSVVYNGYVYEIGGNLTAAVSYAPINTNGTLGAWASTTALPAATASATSVVFNGYIYVIGGNTGAATANVYSALMNTNGTLGAWTATTSLPAATQYATSVVYNGYVYVIGGWNGTTYFSTVSYAPLNTNGTVGAWSANTSLPATTTYATSVVYNGYIYEIGGGTGSSVTSVYYTAINNGGSGTTGTWASTTVLPAATYFATSVVYNGYVYEIGGTTGSATATVEYAPLNANGTIGAWTAITPLPAATYVADSVAYNGYLYEIGGIAGSATTTVDYAPINANGTIGAWTATTPLPAATYEATSVVYNGYLYEIGGWNGTTNFANVYYAPLNANGTIGAWTATTPLPAATRAATSVVYNGYVYEIGSYTTSATATIYYAPMNSNGTIGTWTATTSLPAATYYANTVAYNGYLYEIGGIAAPTSINFAPINANGTIGAWTVTTTLLAATQSATSVVYNGYVYVIGGNTTTAVSYTSLNVMSRVGHYSQMFNFGSLNTPVSISYNGSLPNAFGLSPIQYKIAGSNAVLGSSQYSSVLNGTTADCSTVGAVQYVFANITLDDSSSAAFPDVSTTPANVSDFTVAYTTARPAPNTRMRNGTYFSNEVIQPMDTCALVPIPNTPTIGTATDNGVGRAYNNGSAIVSFTPSASGYAATLYTVTASSGGYTASGTASPITVTGLQSGVAYTFTVRASNAIGSSYTSSVSNSITTTTVPQAVTIGTATDTGSGRAYNNGLATVGFTPGGTGGLATTYVVTASTGGFTGSGGSSPISIAGLQSGVSYTFTVVASNANGSAVASAASNSITATTIPQAPTIGTATNSGAGRPFNNGLATVSYTANGTGGTTVTYTATASPGGYSASGASPISVTGLQSATNYSFTVTATNANGSATSAASNTITATTVPQAPTIGTATATSRTTATVTYTNNATGGSAITGNTVTSSPSSVTGTGASPITVSGLAQGTTYTFTATATNANGTSAASAASNSMTTWQSPSSVTYLVVGGGGGGGAGGGGAGGYLTGSIGISWGSPIGVTVGGGGASGGTGPALGGQGASSSFASIVAAGGGGGGSYSPGADATTGGSSGGNTAGMQGGSSITGYNVATSPAGQGYPGGNCPANTNGRGSGGGGATGYGSACTSTLGGNGGPGGLFSVTGSYYAGGGGGASGLNGQQGGGGSGGGGSGGTSQSPSYPGTANTGGGGGGSWPGYPSSPGGSGIVIVAYPSSYPTAVATTGSVSYVDNGTNKIYTFTGSGSITF